MAHMFIDHFLAVYYFLHVIKALLKKCHRCIFSWGEGGGVVPMQGSDLDPIQYPKH